MNDTTPSPDPVDNLKIVEVGLGAILRPSIDVRAKAGCSTQLLITKRSPGAIMGGYWELPGGKIERGETPTRGVERELREELGVQIILTKSLAPILHTYPHATVRLHTCIGRLANGSPEPQNLEVAEHRWVCADELLGFRFLPANEAILKQIVSAMTGLRDT